MDRAVAHGSVLARDNPRRSVSACVSHYHEERHHQGLGGNLIVGADDNAGRTGGEVQCRERLGGMLRFYYRDAA